MMEFSTDRISGLLVSLVFIMALGTSPAMGEDAPGVVVGEPEPIQDASGQDGQEISAEPAGEIKNVPEGQEASEGDAQQAEDALSEDAATGEGPVDTTGQDASQDDGQDIVNGTGADDAMAEPNAPMDGPNGEPVEEEQADADSTEMLDSLPGMQMWQLLQDDRMLAEFYEVKLEKDLKLGNVEVELKVRQAISDQLLDIPEAPMTIVHVKSNGFEVRHPLYPSRRMEFEYLVPPSEPALLVIHERCDCAEAEGDLAHLFVAYRRILRPLGAVSGVDDVDGDGLYEPFVYEEAFHGGLGILEPDTVIRVKVYFDVDEGRLKPGGQKFALYYLQQITELDKEIAADMANSLAAGDLAPMLRKFLYYRAMGHEDEGWTAFDADIKLYGGHMFPQRTAQGDVPRNIRVEQISNLMRKAFGRASAPR